jgi:LysM repeat protein
METPTSAPARIFAALALVGAVLVMVLAVVAVTNEGSSDRTPHSERQAKNEDGQERTKAKSYTVQTGDTLTSIAHRTGVPVAEILALNPEVDPQILIAGQTLKLR